VDDISVGKTNLQIAIIVVVVVVDLAIYIASINMDQLKITKTLKIS